MEFNILHSVQVEHQELHAGLKKAIASGGETGAAVTKVAEALHIHFEREEKYALPAFGLLPFLVEERINSELARVLEMTDILKAELPRMLEEHRAIVAALQKLIKAASRKKKPEHIHFSEKLILHARNEEEVCIRLPSSLESM